MPARLNPPPEILRATVDHLVSAYPEEGCGILLRRGEGWRFVPMRNAATRFHLADPESFPRDARTAYLFEPAEQRRVWAWARREGWEIAAIVHSHCDEPAEFSDLDREMAMASADEILHPGVAYLVVAVHQGRPCEARVYAWVEGRWCERDIAI